ncbi:MAG: hypothetical protein IPK83_00370 [Planctomycetes bacterium]|nr:hypothetical protein [Planctomycetota bacterium]
MTKRRPCPVRRHQRRAASLVRTLVLSAVILIAVANLYHMAARWMAKTALEESKKAIAECPPIPTFDVQSNFDAESLQDISLTQPIELSSEFEAE